MNLAPVARALAACLCALSVSMARGQSTADQEPISEVSDMSALAKRIAAQLEEHQCPKVTALDFTDMQGRAVELGRYFSDDLLNALFDHKPLIVLDRAHFAHIMKENNMTAKGLMANPAEVNKLGDFERVNAILVGRVTSMNGNLDLTVWGVSIKTAERVASGKITLPMAKDWQGMLTRSVSDGSSSESPAAARSDASIAEGPVLSSTDLGPVTVVLRNVVEQKLPTDRGEVPAIQCSFEVENRDTKRWVAIAANQRVQEDSGYRADSAGYRGGLVDSNQVSWSLVEVTGVSAVRCFEFSTQRITQNNPGAIVDYIRNGKRSEGKAAHFDKGHFWSGSLEFIPPLGRTRVTAVFTPPTPAASKRSRSREEPEKVAPWKQLEFCSLNMELVIGTYEKGQDPLKADDLALRQLAIDRINLASRAKAGEP